MEDANLHGFLERFGDVEVRVGIPWPCVGTVRVSCGAIVYQRGQKVRAEKYLMMQP